MTDKARIKIAAAVTAMFLGAVSAAGVMAHSNGPSTPATAVSQATAPRQPGSASQPNATPGWHEQAEHD
jgi:hypothetical protein